MEVLLAFAGALVSARLAALLLRRWRERRQPELALWSASLLAFAIASGALAWGAAAGWDDRTFRVYYLCGGLLTAALLGLGSLARVGLPGAVATAYSWIGLAVGVGIATPLSAPVSGTVIPDASDHLELLPTRLLAIVGNSAGTAAALAVAVIGLRRRPRGNALILAGLAVAAAGSAMAGLGEGGNAVFACAAAVLLYAGFVSSK